MASAKDTIMHSQDAHFGELYHMTSDSRSKYQLTLRIILSKYAGPTRVVTSSKEDEDMNRKHHQQPTF